MANREKLTFQQSWAKQLETRIYRGEKKQRNCQIRHIRSKCYIEIIILEYCLHLGFTEKEYSL